VSVGNAFDVVGSLLELHASKNNGIITKYLLGVLISARLSAAWSYLHRIVKSPGDDASRYSRDFKDSDLSTVIPAHIQQNPAGRMSTLPSAQFLDLPGEILSQIAS
jgi:hypothetical protein